MPSKQSCAMQRVRQGAPASKPTYLICRLPIYHLGLRSLQGRPVVRHSIQPLLLGKNACQVLFWSTKARPQVQSLSFVGPVVWFTFKAAMNLHNRAHAHFRNFKADDMPSSPLEVAELPTFHAAASKKSDALSSYDEAVLRLRSSAWY